jgi:hypothetical protein
MKNKEMVGTIWKGGGLNTGLKKFSDVAVILSCRGKGRRKYGEAIRIFGNIYGEVQIKKEKYIGDEKKITIGATDFYLTEEKNLSLIQEVKDDKRNSSVEW